MNSISLIVSPKEAEQRLDKFLSTNISDLSRAKLQKSIKNGLCQLNGKAVKDAAVRLKCGDVIEIGIDTDKSRLSVSDHDIEVIWEDADLAICLKPPFLSVHPCPSCTEATFVNRLLGKYPQLLAQGGDRPGIVHRLDKDTSGLIVVALTERARLALTEAFANRQIEKEYLALVSGHPPASGKCLEPIGRHSALKTRMAIVPEKNGGRSAYTEWIKLWQEPENRLALLNLKIHTGRTHQIRVHLAHLGYPILGDKVYAPQKIANMAERQMLHAWKLAFTHPFSGERLNFMAPPPDDFFNAALANSHASLHIIVTGNQGCGKSSFCADLGALGLPVTSADAIVRKLYAGSSQATSWIAEHYGPDTLNHDKSVNKNALFAAMQARPQLRKDFEEAIHGLVREKIEEFWHKHAASEATVAEIPLFFESGYEKGPNDFVVGISCPQKQRWERIRASRGWSEEKITTLESWQWNEDRKMAACDAVIKNDGDAAALSASASDFMLTIRSRLAKKRDNLRQSLYALCDRIAKE